MVELSRNISSEQPPATVDDELSSYLVRMFEQVAIALSQSAQVPISNTLPDKPTDGKIYYFGQTIAPDIISVGFWGFENGAWVKL